MMNRMGFGSSSVFLRDGQRTRCVAYGFRFRLVFLKSSDFLKDFRLDFPGENLFIVPQPPF